MHYIFHLPFPIVYRIYILLSATCLEIVFKYNLIIAVILSQWYKSSLKTISYCDHIQNIRRYLFLLLSFGVLEHKIGISFHDGTCRKIIWWLQLNCIFVITIKGTGEEPKRLRWIAFSFSNLMAFSLLSILVCHRSRFEGIYYPHQYSVYDLKPINNTQTGHWQFRDHHMQRLKGAA